MTSMRTIVLLLAFSCESIRAFTSHHRRLTRESSVLKSNYLDNLASSEPPASKRPRPSSGEALPYAPPEKKQWSLGGGSGKKTTASLSKLTNSFSWWPKVNLKSRKANGAPDQTPASVPAAQTMPVEAVAPAAPVPPAPATPPSNEPAPAPKEPSHSSQMAAMFEDPTFADVVFDLDGTRVTAHRAVLVCRSAYFRNMLASAAPAQADQVIEVEGWKHPGAFRAILRYLYTDELTFEEADILHVMRKANEMKLDRVVEYTMSYCKEYINVSNAVKWFVQADEFGLPEMRAVAFSYLTKNFRRVRKEARGTLVMLEERNKLMMEVMLSAI